MTTLGSCLGALSAVAALALAAGALGKIFTRRVAPLEPGTELLAGFGILGLGIFLVGMVYWSTAVAWAVVAPLAVWGALRLRRPRRFRLPSGWLWAVVPLGGWLLLLALVPPMGSGGANDVIGYHLAGPEAWLDLHHIGPLLDNAPTAYPATIECLHAALIAISNPRATGVLSLLFLGLLLAEIWHLVRDWGGDSYSAGLAVAIAGTASYYLGWAAGAWVDIAYAAFALAAARLLFRATAKREWIAAGFFFGFAIGIKYFGLTLLAVSVPMALLAGTGRRKRTLVDLIWVVAVAAAVGGIWYVRNWIVLGTPIYPPPPSLARFLPARYLSLDAAQRFQDVIWNKNPGLGRNFLALILLPFHFTFQSAVFYGGEPGILPLAFAPWGLWRLGRGRRREFLFWLGWSGALTLLWFTTLQIGRFLMPAVAVMVALAGLGGGWLLRAPSLCLRRLALAAVAVALFMGYGKTLWNGGRNPPMVASLFSRERAQRLWKQNVPFAGAYLFLNQPGETGPVLIADRYAASYYLHRPYRRLEGEYGERPYGALSLEQALRRLPGWGVREVLDVSWPDAPGFQIATPPPGWRLVYASDRARVYALP